MVHNFLYNLFPSRSGICPMINLFVLFWFCWSIVPFAHKTKYHFSLPRFSTGICGGNATSRSSLPSPASLHQQHARWMATMGPGFLTMPYMTRIMFRTLCGNTRLDSQVLFFSVWAMSCSQVISDILYFHRETLNPISTNPWQDKGLSKVLCLVSQMAVAPRQRLRVGHLSVWMDFWWVCELRKVS